MADDKAKKVPLEVSMMNRIGELKAENARLKQQVEYWRIESDCNHGRWLRCLEDLEHLRASSFVTAVPSEEYEKAQAEVARLKAECQARQAENSVLAVECDSLKAEVERLTQLNDTLALRYDATKSMLDGCAKEIEEMEAEVERLTSDIQMEKENEDRLVREWQRANNEVYGLKTQVAALIDELERLRKGVQP